MKAALVTTFGGPDVVSIGTTALSDPQANDVTVRVEAAGINPLDLKILAGYMQQVFPVELPYVPGSDFSGVIEAVGANVTHLQAGDRVFGRTAPSKGGAFAQRLVIAADDLCIIPAGNEFRAGRDVAHGVRHGASGALRCRPFAARGARADSRRSRRRRQHGGAVGARGGGVRHRHRVGAQRRTGEKPRCRRSDRLPHAGLRSVRDIDLVLDTMGGETLEKSWQVLRAGGRIATLLEFGIEPRNGHAGEAVFFTSATPSLPEAVRHFQAGQLQIVTDSIFPLEETRAALEKVATGHARGKVLIRTRN